METELTLEFSVETMDFTRAGDAAGKIKQILRQAGIPGDISRKAAIIAYEAEMNLVIHSLGGVITLQVTSNKIKIAAEDSGPGIPDIELALKEGYSTASDEIRELGFGAGMGLANIKRNADKFSLESQVNKGTTLITVIDIS